MPRNIIPTCTGNKLRRPLSLTTPAGVRQLLHTRVQEFPLLAVVVVTSCLEVYQVGRNDSKPNALWTPPTCSAGTNVIGGTQLSGSGTQFRDYHHSREYSPYHACEEDRGSRVLTHASASSDMACMHLPRRMTVARVSGKPYFEHPYLVCGTLASQGSA